jgi:hypothetical protein
VSQSSGFVSHKYLVRFAGCQNWVGNLAPRIASLKMRGPKARVMCCVRARGRTSSLGTGGTAEIMAAPSINNHLHHPIAASGLKGGSGVHIGPYYGALVPTMD